MPSVNRKSPRLQGYDYSAYGAYFITICTKDRKPLLSRIQVGAGVLDGPCVRMTEIGKTVEAQILEINRTYQNVEIRRYCIMPNHVHLLILISGGPSRTPAPTNAAIPSVISVFKRFTNRNCSEVLWQRSYHDHIIRSEDDYRKHWQYIDENPAKWAEDEYFTL